MTRTSVGRSIANEKYTGRVLLQKTIGMGGSKIKNDGFMDQYLYSDSHEAIISDEMFIVVQQEKLKRAKNSEYTVAMNFIF